MSHKYNEECCCIECCHARNNGKIKTMSAPEKPDYGEPWEVGRIDRPMEDRHGHDPLMLHSTASRAVDCVNACAGMDDPAKGIANLRRFLDAALNDNLLKQHGAQNAKLHMDTMREAIKAAHGALQMAAEEVNSTRAEIAVSDALTKLEPFIKP